MKGHPLVNKELKKFQDRKAELLKMKKSERGDELKTVDEGIARMKRWNRELEATQRRKEMKQAGEKMAKACQETVKAVKELSEALGKLQSNEKPRGVNPVVYR